jgi:FkbM family methyltransferase
VINVHNKAITSRRGLVGFEYQENHSGAGRLTEKGFMVKSVDHKYLDKLLENTVHPLFVKIDVEGGEYEVLSQISMMKKFSDVKYVFIELNDSLSNVSLLRKFLAENRFVQIYETKITNNPDGFFVRE